eukprot:Sspe_Gene.89790::Locus_61467_Transcript_1_1_Confidence_1.000_Length_1031::g.89790::m.89790
MALRGAVPEGLSAFCDVLSASECRLLATQALSWHSSALASRGKKVKAKTYLSKQHNLPDERYYYPVRVTGPDGTVRLGQHFELYGEKGHTLTYYIGTPNLPPFASEILLPKVAPLLCPSDSHVAEWNMTFNTYVVDGEKVGSFPFHVDIPSNGEVTGIFSLGGPAEMAIRPLTDEPHPFRATTCLPLWHNTMVVMAGPSRWDFEHSVREPAAPNDHPPYPNLLPPNLHRISVVLGCTFA